jgi:hypothetical protein
MYLRGAVIWLGILVLASLNGAVRTCWWRLASATPSLAP